MMSQQPDLAHWEAQFAAFLAHHQSASDAAHDEQHIRRVVANARALALVEQAELAVILPAAWLHDCVIIAKDSPLRATASRLAAQRAVEFLATSGYPSAFLPAIYHAIEAHSFSANIAPRSREAMIVQDADRLDALGAIGLARCLMLGGAMQRRLYDPHEPLPQTRPLDEQQNTIDHFYTKLLLLAARMNTAAGRAEASKRTAFIEAFLAQLASELP